MRIRVGQLQLNGWGINHQTINKVHHPKTRGPRCYAKSQIAQDKFQPIPGLISCIGVNGDGDCYLMQSGGSLVEAHIGDSNRQGRKERGCVSPKS